VTNKPRRSRRTKAILLVLLACLLVALSGCETISYYRQAIAGQYEIFSKQQPVKHLLAKKETPAALKEKLKLVLELRAFAETNLSLPVDGHYLKYANLNRKHVVWNVYAAPELSLEQKTWWYPVVGKLKYRGYFTEARATNYAAKLRRQCWDVYVSGVDAYSTLGWFKESLLSTFIDDKESDLAETLFHELAHQRVFIAGDTDFNEAFATVVGQEGARRWLRSRQKTDTIEEYSVWLEREGEFVHLVQGAREKLKAVYNAPQEEASKRAAKTDIIEELRRDYQELRNKWGGYPGYDRWFAKPINNAQLNTVATYYDLVPAFERRLAAHGGNLESFYKEVERLEKLGKEERRARLGAGQLTATEGADSTGGNRGN
jgi:predicted aminopeptidase